MRILLATYPFAQDDDSPLRLLKETGWEIVPNPYGRRLREGEVAQLMKDVDGVIAGTEPYTAEAIAAGAGRLKVIARAGIGLDNVDIPAALRHGIAVTYTPDAPSPAVAELTVAQILNLSRHTHQSDRSVREHAWNRLMGWLLGELRIGILGLGRIGKRVAALLQPFDCEILGCDIAPDTAFAARHGLRLVGAEELFRSCDLVTVHIPMNEANRHFVGRRLLSLMKTGSKLVNTSRGPVLDEAALADALAQKHLGGAALDVFEREPYEGPLTRLDNVLFTAHMGASARRCRVAMEYESAEDCVRVLKGERPRRPAPESEPLLRVVATGPGVHSSLGDVRSLPAAA